jgi:hypothetical protein
MNGDVTQPPATEGPHPEGASTYRGGTLARHAVVVGVIVVVGALAIWTELGTPLSMGLLMVALLALVLAPEVWRAAREWGAIPREIESGAPRGRLAMR